MEKYKCERCGKEVTFNSKVGYGVIECRTAHWFSCGKMEEPKNV